MDYRNGGWDDFHCILYGHHLNDKTMFWPLNQYRNSSFWNSHQTVEIYVEGKVYIYTAFSFYKSDSIGEAYDLDLLSDQAKSDWIREMQNNSMYTTDLNILITDKILTLSTCVANEDDNRWVLHLVRTNVIDLTASEQNATEPQTQE